MKITKCYIENFGKLQNFTYNFDDGLNIIKEDNGFGKTTFATFIKSMFYGLDVSNRKEDSDRVKYKPWQGGIFGGNIEFEIDGKRYRIERFFGSKSSEDTFKLYNLETNLESKDFSSNIGEEIFKINKEGYERSTYIPQGQIPVNMEDSINAKLGNVLENENDINTSEEAIKRILDSMKFYIMNGNKGMLNQKKERLNELNRKFENSKFDSENLEVRKKMLEEKMQQIKQKEIERAEKQNLLSKKMEQDRIQAKKETYDNIINKIEESKEKYEKIKSEFSSEIDDIDNKIKQEEESKEPINKKMKDLKRIIEKKDKTLKLIFINGIIATIAGTILLFVKLPIYIGVILISIGMTCLSLDLFTKRNNNALEDSYKDLKKKFDEIEVNINNLQSNKEVIKNLREGEMKTSEEDIEKSELLKKQYEDNNDIQSLNQNEVNLEGFNEQNLTFEINNLAFEIDKLNDEKNQNKNQIEILENKIDENEFLESDIENLKDEIKEMEQKYSILEKTKEYLESAKESFSSSYLKGMINNFENNLKLLNNDVINADVDINLDVKLDSNGSKKDLKFFSAGYKDLIYICIRFALIQSLFQNETPFVILDDPFTNLDETKTEKALNLVNELAKDYQIIYFVCNESRV